MELSHEEIRILIEANEVEAISLDTSTIQAQHFKFESGMLKQLEQFIQKSDIELVISDVVKGEIQVHIEKSIIEAKEKIDGALKQAKTHWKVGDDGVKEVERIIYQERQPKDMALKKINKFLELTDSEVIEAEDNLNISDLLEKYFKSTPPFATTGKKKNEFPDAIAFPSGFATISKNEDIVTSQSKFLKQTVYEYGDVKAMQEFTNLTNEILLKIQ